MYCPLAEKGCGGCSDINKMYGDTLTVKEEALRKLFPQTKKMLGCETPLRYRNKVLRTFADGKDQLYSGIYRAGTHQVISLRSCCLEDERLNTIAFKATRLLADAGFKAWREDFRRGQLRHMVLRRAPATGQILVTLITGTEDIPGLKETAERLMRENPDIKGIVQNINDRSGSAVMGFHDKLLCGRDEIWDRLSGLHVCLSHKVFYQVNAPQAARLYRIAIEAAELTEQDRVLDAYCGVGAIGMLAAEKVGHVTGIEISPDAVRCAQKARKRNGIDNISFLQGDASKALAKNEEHYTCVFMDPPREGLSPAFIDGLKTNLPEKLVYISCNPETLKRDTDLLTAAGYGLRFTRGVDLFPFTKHVETVALMSRINK